MRNRVPCLVLASALSAVACRAPAPDAAPAAPEPRANKYAGAFSPAAVTPAATEPVAVRAEVGPRGAAPLPALPTVRGEHGDADASLRARIARESVRGLTIRDEESLRKVAAHVRAVTGLPLVVHPASENAALDAGVVFNLEIEHALTVRHLLNLIAEQAGEEVVWTVKHEAVLFTTTARGRDLVLRMHGIGTLVAGRTDFLAPRIDRLRLVDELEDDDGGGPFGGTGEVVRAMDEDAVVTLVQEHVAPGTWEDDGVSIEAHEGSLFVVHTPEVQRQVQRFLARLGN